MRLGVGAFFIVHGVSKLMNMNAPAEEMGTVAMFGQMGLSPVLAWAVAIIEALGGLALVLGVLLPLVTVLLAIIMLVAMRFVWSMGFIAGWGPNSVYLLTLLGLLFTGPGEWALLTGKRAGHAAAPSASAQSASTSDQE